MVIFTIAMTLLTACGEKTSGVITETVVETFTETVIETVEITLESPFTYETLREMAKTGMYEGNPAAGHTMAFANTAKSLPFCTAIENNIIEEWKLAGGSMDDLTLLDNDTDTLLALQNAEIILNENPEVFLEFQSDTLVNAQIGRKAKELGIFIIAIDVPVPGFPFMGINNYGSSVLTGNWAVDQIDAVYGSWENVDRVFFLWNPDIGDEAAMRVHGSIDVFKERFGDEADDTIEGAKAVIVDAGCTIDEADAAMAGMLAAYPTDENIMVFCLNDQTAAGVQAAADIAGRWDPDNWMIMSQGLDDLGKQLIREGIIDGSSAFFPEKYGEYLIPGALAHMYGNPVPSHMFIENIIITPDNINEYF